MSKMQEENVPETVVETPTESTQTEQTPTEQTTNRSMHETT